MGYSICIVPKSRGNRCKINSVPAALKGQYCLLVSLWIVNLTSSFSPSDAKLPMAARASFTRSNDAILKTNDRVRFEATPIQTHTHFWLTSFEGSVHLSRGISVFESHIYIYSDVICFSTAQHSCPYKSSTEVVTLHSLSQPSSSSLITQKVSISILFT